jgi:hypothetical protein|tara:strand:- start:2025 stop:3380 length:1356 start_codon:yes stop_codon:yes gene_type:complete
MTVSAYVDEGKCLVFPTMCDAYIHLEYAKHNMNTNNGLWNINGSFTGQFIIKPYDVNGYGDNTGQTNKDLVANGGAGNITNKKTMPAIADGAKDSFAAHVFRNNQAEKYLPNRERYLAKDMTGQIINNNPHEMCLFHNNNITVNLVNTTDHNQNNPAEYKVQFKLTIDGTETILESTNVFTSRKYHYSDVSKVRNQVISDGSTVTVFDDYHLQFVYDKYKIIGKEAGQPPHSLIGNEYKEGYTIKFTPGNTPTSEFNTNLNQAGIVINDPTGNQPTPFESIPIGTEMFTEDGISLGKVMMVIPKAPPIFPNHAIAFHPLPAGSTIPILRDGAKIYTAIHREPMYIHTTTHISVAYEQTTRRMSIFANGIEVATTTHDSTTGSFSLDASDVYIGQNATLAYPNDRKTQFMGELDSILFTDTYMTNYTHLFNPVAPYQNIMLYYDFSEGRDNG